MGIIVALLGVAAAAAIVLGSAHASLTPDSVALAKVGMPLGGGKIESVSVVTGPRSKPVKVDLRDDRLWPVKLLGSGRQVSIEVVVRRPGWISWLAGKTQTLDLTLTTPSASVTQQYVTLARGAPVTVRFAHPVSAIAYGRPGHLHRQILGAPRSEVALKRTAQAGSIWIAGMPRSWESSKAALVSWFPAGAGATAVANPAPGTNIGSTTPIRLTFSTPVQQALHGSKPALSPSTPGTWHSIDSHTIIFKPQDFGYGLGAKVTVGLPSGVRLSGAGSSTGTWNVPPGSTVRLQQLLAMLNYLPLRFTYKHGGVPLTPAAQEAAAIHPPAGTFSWRFDNVPSSLRSMWAPGALGVVTRGAVMRFQDDHGLSTDGVAGPSVWRALFTSVLTRHRSSFGYTFVSVDMSSPETLTLWHDGKNVITTPVNTGIPSRPTAPGTFPVFEHIRVGTMSGTNPDGSHYNDPGIQFISYFNGGDALHAFSRAQFGFPQSLGCVEMELGAAGTVWPYTPIGTLVHVA